MSTRRNGSGTPRRAGWSTPTNGATGAAAGVLTPGRYVVIARTGLKLRGGPGTNLESKRTLPTGTELNVVEVGGQDRSWAHVDPEGDGLLDGYVFATFLAPAVTDHEHVAEPDSDDN